MFSAMEAYQKAKANEPPCYNCIHLFNDGKVLICKKSDKFLLPDFLPNNCEFKERETMNNIDWDKAENHLNMVISEYCAIGFAGSFALNLTLLPLKKRLDNGERTQELYNEIMESE